MISYYDMTTGEQLSDGDAQPGEPCSCHDTTAELRLLTVDEAIAVTPPRVGPPADIAMRPVSEFLARWR